MITLEKRNLARQAYAIANSIGAPRSSDGSLWPSYPLACGGGMTTTRLPSPADPYFNEDIDGTELAYLEMLIRELKALWRNR